MNMLLFADAIRNFAQIIVNVLAIAGAFLVGMILTHGFLSLSCHLLFRKQPPQGVKKVTRLLGGVLLAIGVAFLVFGDGTGWGIGTGNTTGQGDSTKPGPKQELSVASQFPISTMQEPKEDPKPPEEVKPKVEPKELPMDETERIVILGGYDVLQRYYRIEGKGETLNLSQLTQFLKARKTDPTKPLKGITILVFKDSATTEGPVVAQLRKWAEDNGLGVYFPAVSNQARPAMK